MKKNLFSIVMLLMFSVVLHAQNDVTQFLGIPVDGSKSEMLSKLKTKGFRSSSYKNDVLTGEFNGTQVDVHVATNNDKVWRIMVCDANNVDERAIQIRFNRLCEQFTNNSKYTPLEEDQTIPDGEDISYEITVHKKRYEAIFYQKPDMGIVTEKMKAELLAKYTKEQLENLTEKDLQSEALKVTTEYLREVYSKKSVWFMISDYHGKFYIIMYYDNEYNRANGEDL